MTKRSLFTYLCVISIFYNESIFANDFSNDNDIVNDTILDDTQGFAPMYPLTQLPRNPRGTFWGFTGDKTLGKGQILFPITADVHKAFYLAAEGSEAVNSSDWMAGLGAGYRQIVNNNILGGYLLGDYNIADKAKFFVLNPGFESLGTIWDWRANGYFPFGSKNKVVSHEIGWESDIGNYSYVQTTGHTWADNQYGKIDYVRLGNGMDLELGRTFTKLHNLKTFLGGYFFDIKDDSSVTGVEARINYPVNDYLSFEARDTYDNYQYNKFLLGFKVQLGGLSQEEADNLGLAARLLDPIEHNIAASASGNTVPVKQLSQISDLGHSIVRYDDVQYVDNNAVAGAASADVVGDGTYENPYQELNNDTITAIENQGVDTAHIFVENTGSAYNIGGTTTLVVPQYYSIWGFDNNFRTLASGDGRPELDGSMQILGDNSLSSFELNYQYPGSGTTTALTIGDGSTYADNVSLDNVLIDASTSRKNTNIYAIDLNYGHLILEDNNTITSFSNANSYSLAYGIFATNNSIVDIAGNNNDISATNTNVNDSVGIELLGSTLNIMGDDNSIIATAISTVHGIQADDQSSNASVINISGNNNTVSATQTGNSSSWDTYGILLNGNGTLNISGDSNAISATSSVGPVIGIYAAGNNAITMSGNNNTISTTNTSGTTTYAYGIQLNGNGALNISGDSNAISATGSGPVIGIYAAGNNAITISGNNNTISAANTGNTGHSAYGIQLTNNSIFNISGDNNAISATVHYTSATAIGIYASGNNAITISGDNNSITADNTITGGTLSGFSDYGINLGGSNDTLTISGNNNTISATGATTPSHNAFAITVNTSSTAQINITGQNTTLSATNTGSGNATGLYIQQAGASSSVDIANTTFNVTTASDSDYGINIASGANFVPDNLTVTNSTFNVSSGSATAYGIYNGKSTKFTLDKFNYLIDNNTFADTIQSGNRVYPIVSSTPMPVADFYIIDLNTEKDLTLLQQYFSWQ